MEGEEIEKKRKKHLVFFDFFENQIVCLWVFLTKEREKVKHRSRVLPDIINSNDAILTSCIYQH